MSIVKTISFKERQPHGTVKSVITVSKEKSHDLLAIRVEETPGFSKELHLIGRQWDEIKQLVSQINSEK